MKTILVTAYAVNPYKGSEDGMGWNFILQSAKYNSVIAVTRKNNAQHIEKYLQQNAEAVNGLQNIRFLYFDWPKKLLFWKKGPLLSLIYFYLWQISLALWIRKQRFYFDASHNLNFHNDWTPTFLWLCGKPLVWGPVGHHSKIPRAYLLPVYGMKEYMKDRFTWMLKNIFWLLDPFLFISKMYASHILCMNSAALKKMKSTSADISLMPSVATIQNDLQKNKNDFFSIISVGRFVPLKGFDITIRSFAAFYHSLISEEKKNIKLSLIGSGPQENMLRELIVKENVADAVEIIGWLPKEELHKFYRSASVFLFPSHEGAGMVVAEAMSYGLPVICIRNDGPGEFIHPESMLSVPYQTYNISIRRIAKRLDLLYKNNELYEKESALAYNRYASHFSWENRGEQLKNIYASISTITENEYRVKPVSVNFKRSI